MVKTNKVQPPPLPLAGSVLGLGRGQFVLGDAVTRLTRLYLTPAQSC